MPPFFNLYKKDMREFLSFFTRFNCQSLTAMEFLELPLTGTALDPEQLCRLFRTWDTLRFSGKGMEIADLFEAIEDVSIIIFDLDKDEREKRLPESPGMPAISLGKSS